MSQPNQESQTNSRRKWLFYPALALGVLVIVILVKNKAVPQKQSLEEQSRSVRVIAVPSVAVLPAFTGTGNVEPGHVWNGVAEVSGTIVELSPRFNQGEIIQAGEVLLRIDPRDYQLKIAQAETAIDAIQAQIAEIGVREKNSRASLKIEQENLTIGQAELDRKEQLLAKGMVARSDFEREKRTVLSQTQGVQSLKNALDLYPAERTRMQAELKRLKAQLAGTQLDLERTTMNMPFPGRVAETRVELNQYVRQGEVLVAVDSIEKAEVTVQLQPSVLAKLVNSDQILNPVKNGVAPIGDALGLSARVAFSLAGDEITWPARVVRVSDRLDPQTRTVGLIVEVDHPYENIQPGVRPPLVKGTFVEVRLTGTERPDRLVVPPAALHGESIYIVSEENRLQKAAVEIEQRSADYLVIKSGLQPGQKVVVSDLVPAIEGMLLNPVDDSVTLNRLVSAASGQVGKTP